MCSVARISVGVYLYVCFGFESCACFFCVHLGVLYVSFRVILCIFRVFSCVSIRYRVFSCDFVPFFSSCLCASLCVWVYLDILRM